MVQLLSLVEAGVAYSRGLKQHLYQQLCWALRQTHAALQ